MAERLNPLRKVDQVKQALFLKFFAECGNVRLAANQAGIARTTHYAWLKDESYRTAFEGADAQAADILEAEARRRGLEGWEEPVFYKGEACGAVRRYSDTLLIFLLKGARPEKYRERQEIQHTGDLTFTLNIPKPTKRGE